MQVPINRNEYAKALDINQGILIDFQIHGKLQPICQFRLATFLHSHPPGCDHIQTRHLQISTHFFLVESRCYRFLIILLPRWLLVQLGVFLVLQHGLNTRWPFWGRASDRVPHTTLHLELVHVGEPLLRALAWNPKKWGFLLLKIHPPPKKNTCKSNIPAKCL